jgi:hypothetical protein
VEATPKFQNTNQIDQIAQSSHQGGADFNGYSNNPGGNKESLQVAKPPTVTLSNQILYENNDNFCPKRYDS